MLENKVVLVTGASRGIGMAIAQALAAEGAVVVGTATTAIGAAKINAFGIGMVLDVTNQASIDEVLATMEKTVGMPTILINNAGITADNLLMRMRDNEWDAVINANLTGAFRLVRACLRSMLKLKWGRIVNVSSVVACTGNPGQANYAAAKSGMIGLTKSVAYEVASRGITVNVVAPGFIATDMTNGLSPEQQAKLLERIPMARMGSADDVAAVVKFLVSDGAAYITGETIHINGGMLMS